MLNTSIGILNPSSLGGGQYSLNIYFQDATKARYLRVGDYIKSSSGDRYEVITWNTYPSDFSSSGSVTTEFVDNDVSPPADSGYNSLVYTPNQIDVNPFLRVGGGIGDISLYSGQNYEYTLTGAWDDGVEANKAQIGDNILDSNGKEFEITAFPGDKFNDPFRVTEREKEGQAPAAGNATLYRPTSNYELYQGNELSDPARTIAYNKDNFYIDKKVKELEGLIDEESTLIVRLENTTGSTIIAEKPVCSVSGKIQVIDVSSEPQVFSLIGVTQEDISDSTSGPIVTQGILKDVNITGSVDDPIYISKTGALTTTKPSIGVDGFSEGDFAIFVGKLTENQDDPSKLDLLINIQIMAQL